MKSEVLEKQDIILLEVDYQEQQYVEDTLAKFKAVFPANKVMVIPEGIKMTIIRKED